MSGYMEGTRAATYEYNDAGSRIRARKTENGAETANDTYTYDAEQRLVGLNQGAHTYAYTYDYRTRRVERIEDNTATQVIFSGGTSVQERENGATTTVEYVRGSDWGGGVGGILYTLRGGTPSYTHYDGRGDVTVKTSNSGAVTYQASYEAFGTRTVEQGTTSDRQKANTKEEDPSGFLNEGMRYRDLETGTFITADPAGFVDGPNVYAYVRQNPWTMFDPEGLEANVAKYRRDDAFYHAAVSCADVYSGHGQHNSGNTEFGSNVYYDPRTKLYGYTTPYTDHDATTVRPDLTVKPREDCEVTDVTHNHPRAYPGGPEFSSTETANSAQKGNDKKVSETIRKPSGVAAFDPTTGQIVVRRYTPKPGGASKKDESGTVDEYDPKTKTWRPITPTQPPPTQGPGTNLPERVDDPKGKPTPSVPVEKPNKKTDDKKEIKKS